MTTRTVAGVCWHNYRETGHFHVLYHSWCTSKTWLLDALIQRLQMSWRKTSPVGTASILLAVFITQMSLCSPASWAAVVSVPSQPKVTYSKAIVTWPRLSETSNLSFAVTYGKQLSFCVNVDPPRLASKFTWQDPDGLLRVIPGTDPGCNGGQGGFLTVQAVTNSVGIDCNSPVRTVTATMHGREVSRTQGVVMRPTGTAAQVFSVFVLPSSNMYGLGSKWHVFFNSADAPPGISPDFDGLYADEDPIDLQTTCEGTPIVQHGGGTIGMGEFPHNAVDDENASFSEVLRTNCQTVFTQAWKIGVCETPANRVTWSFDANGVTTITRDDGNKPVTPSTNPSDP